MSPGDVVAGYRLVLRLGSGTSGEVWEGHHEVSQERAAIKVLRETASEPARERFVREARTVARLRHEHIVGIFDFGDDFIVSALVEGRDLAARLETTIAPRLAVRIAMQIGAALEHAHAHDVVHHDVKPANILVDDNDSAFLADFGLATLTGESAGGAGTPAYMPPEQERGVAPAPSMDQYALGRTLLEMLLGRPVDDPTHAASLAAFPESLPRALRDVVARALQPDPAARWPDVASFVRALGAVDLSAFPAPTVIASPVRDETPFAWATAPTHVVEHSAQIQEARFDLASTAAALGKERLAAFRAMSGYASLGWSVFARVDRVGAPVTAEALARARGLVVILPGMVYSRDSWAHVARAVCRDRAQTLVVTAEALGFQDSAYTTDPPDRAHVSAVEQLTGILGWLDLLGLRSIPTTIVGHSVLTVALLALSDDALGPATNRLAVTPIFPFANRSWQQTFFGTSLLERYAPLLDWYARPRLIAKLAEAVRDLDAEWQADALADAAAYPSRTIGAFARHWIRARAVDGAQQRRCKWLAGTVDPTVPADVTRRAAKELGFDEANLHWALNRGHYPHLSRADEPEASTRNIDQIVRLIGALQRDVDHGADGTASATEPG